MREAVSIERYVQLINEKVREHPLYRRGMEATLSLEGPEAGRLVFTGAGEGEGNGKAAFAWAQVQVDLAYKPEDDSGGYTFPGGSFGDLSPA